MTVVSNIMGKRFVLTFVWASIGLLVAGNARAHAAEDPFYAGLSESESRRAGAELQNSLETSLSNEMAQWVDGESGTRGSVTPIRTYRIKTGNYCRDYREVILANRAVRSRAGTACRTGDGVWIVVTP